MDRLKRSITRWFALAALAMMATAVACTSNSQRLPTPGTASQPPLGPPAPPGAGAVSPSAVAPARPSGTLPLRTLVASQPPDSAASAPASGDELWQPLANFPSADAFEVTSVTAHETGFVAVGFGGMPGEGYYGRHQGIVWRSPDGRSWSAEADPAFQFATPEDVVSLGDSVYIFGSIAMCDAPFAEDCVELPEAGWAVWRSSAGGPWERLPQFPEMQLGSVDGAVATDAQLVAFGWTGDDAQPIIWTSADGVAWSSVRELPVMTQVTAAQHAPAGLVAFGNDYADDIEDLQLVAAFAPDGVHFGPAVVPPLVGTTIRSLARGPSVLVAVGETENEDLNFTAVALSSADGSTWTQAADSDGGFVGSAASFVHAVSSGYVGVGFSVTDDELGTSTGISWFSADGQAWRRLAPFGGEFSVLNASAAGAPGIVVFSVTTDEPDEDTVVSTVSGWLASAEALSALP